MSVGWRADIGESTYPQDGREGPRSGYEPDVQTIPELGAELRSLRHELRGYVQRHDREHERMLTVTERQAERLTTEVAANTQWRTARQAQEGLVRWLVGSNLAVIAGLVLLVLDQLAR